MSTRPPTTSRTASTARAFGVVALGGSVGAVARVECTRLFPTAAGAFPWTTLLVNLSGALLLGVLVVLIVERRTAHPLVRPLLATGVLGAFTTFSTFAVEADLLVRASKIATAVAYVAVSLAGGMLAVTAGTVAARRLTGPGGTAARARRERER